MRLNDQGKLVLEAFGEGTEEEIVSFAYPVLDQALSDAYGDGVYDSYEALPPDRRTAIAKAVEAERSRIAGDQTPRAEPKTEIGRDVKKQTDIPTVLVDRIVGHVATTKLKESGAAASRAELIYGGCLSAPPPASSAGSSAARQLTLMADS